MTLPLIAHCALTDAVEAMEACVGAGDWRGAARYFTADVSYRVGTRTAVRGVDGIRDYMEWQTARVRWDGHDVMMKFSRAETAVFEVASHFTRLSDGAQLIVPCTDIYRFRDGLIHDWRVYADTSSFES
jgi:ketosteroid isomerase-like protein